MAPSPDYSDPLHERLLNRDPTAPSDLAVAFLEPLITWLTEQNPSIDSHMIAEAGEEAILALIRRPESYKPELATLEAYLRMSARGDLRNLLQRESHLACRREPWTSVELSPKSAEYLGVDDDPSLPMQVAEEKAKRAAGVAPAVRAGLTEPELRVLELMLEGERTTAAFAEAYGIGNLPVDEKRRVIKRIKDKLQKRLDRTGYDNERAR